MLISTRGRSGCSVLLAGALWLTLTSWAKAEPPIRIGGSIGLSGQYAALAQNQLCVQDTNTGGGVFGRAVELIPEVDRSDRDSAAGVYAMAGPRRRTRHSG